MNEGTVKFFNAEKGYGFITDEGSGQEYFVHISGVAEPIDKDDRVQFELQEGRKGMNAVNVKRV